MMILIQLMPINKFYAFLKSNCYLINHPPPQKKKFKQYSKLSNSPRNIKKIRQKLRYRHYDSHDTKGEPLELSYEGSRNDRIRPPPPLPMGYYRTYQISEQHMYNEEL